MDIKNSAPSVSDGRKLSVFLFTPFYYCIFFFWRVFQSVSKGVPELICSTIWP